MMKHTNLYLLGAVCLLLLVMLSVPSYAVQVWDLSADWPSYDTQPTVVPSVGIGPEGAWSYGYDGNTTNSAFLDYTFTPWTATDNWGFGILGVGVYTGYPLASWVAVGKCSQPQPAMNLQAGDIGGHTAGWTDPILFRWTAPRNMTVNIEAKCWIALVTGGGNNEFGIRKGTNAPLFDGWVMAGTNDRTNPLIATANGVSVQAGDVLDYYAVGSVQTGFAYKITEVVPEPGSLLALATGMLGLVGFVVRRGKN